MPSVPIFCRFEVGGSQVQNCFKLGKELAPKAHVQVKFCSDPVRSEDYFPEWKPALSLYRRSDLQFTTKQTCQTVKFFFAQGFLRHFLRGTDTYEMKLAKQKPTFLDWTTHSMNHFVSMVLLSRQFLTGSMLQKSARIAREISSMRGQKSIKNFCATRAEQLYSLAKT